MMRFAHLAQRIFNRPVAILPEKAEIIVAALADRLGVATLGGRAIAAYADPMIAATLDDDLRNDERDRGYDVVERVGIIPVSGTLTHRLGCLRPLSGMTGYDGIRQSFIAAMDDPDVAAIMLDIDSPGGEVAGMFDLADMIFEARGQKPIWAILDESAFSAAYCLAAACDRITVPRTGGVGSIGAVCMHVDLSQALENAGINVTLIQYGARKTDFAEVKPLSREALQAVQAEVDTIGEMFVDAVARYRGLRPAAVAATQAATFMGSLGVNAGLADAVMSPDVAFASLQHTISGQ